MRRRRGQATPLLLVLAGAILLLVFVISLFNISPEDEAERLVTEFYEYEKDADFGRSWELFHPLMKKRFDKSSYIQQRNHVFVGHFGTDTFKYTIGDVEKMKSWKMAKNATTLHDVYKVPVTQTYKSTYGTFTIHQDIFVTEEKGNWGIIWSYN